MCGIAGGFNHSITEQARISVRDRLRHRGPDDDGFYQNGAVWLLNTRLAIQDVSRAGHQPMQTPDGRYTIVFNGEIYNHPALRSELQKKGAAFHSSCDTETLLQAYAHWGKDCLKKLNGDFAFAVWDAEKQELFLARDPMGVKPLYYYQSGETLVFCSEIQALCAALEGCLRVQPAAFFPYLLFQYSPGDATPFGEVKKLLPGHFFRMSLATGRQHLERYYRTQFEQGRKKKESDYVDELHLLLIDALKAQLHSDRPSGFFLSGGLDSSLLLAAARRQQPDATLDAFTIRYEQAQAREKGFSADYDFAIKAAEASRARLHAVDGAIDYAAETDRMVLRLGEPQADPAAIHTAHIAAAAKEMGIAVLISGTGADDIFSGYRRHLSLPYVRYAKYVPSFANDFLDRGAKLIPALEAANRRYQKVAAAAKSGAENYMTSLHYWAYPQDAAALFTKAYRAQLSEYHPGLILLGPEPSAGLSKLNLGLLIEQQSFLPHHNLAYLDKLCMASSVEARVPYLDGPIVAFANALPEEMKLRSGRTKYVLRMLAERYLPPEIIRRRKTGFGAPLRDWMRAGGTALARERLLDGAFIAQGIFEPAAIGHLINDAGSGGKGSAYTLFSLLCIESWLRQFA